jgi:hypothetical protein
MVADVMGPVDHQWYLRVRGRLNDSVRDERFRVAVRVRSAPPSLNAPDIDWQSLTVTVREWLAAIDPGGSDLGRWERVWRSGGLTVLLTAYLREHSGHAPDGPLVPDAVAP